MLVESLLDCDARGKIPVSRVHSFCGPKRPELASDYFSRAPQSAAVPCTSTLLPPKRDYSSYLEPN